MIKLIRPNLELWGVTHTKVYKNKSDRLVSDIIAFYDSMLVPEMVCSPTAPDRPQELWLASEGKKIVVCMNQKKEIIGCWVLKDHQIMYPCINVAKGVEGVIAILRALAYASFEEEGNDMWASTDNPLIKAWATKAINTPETGRPAGMPSPSFNGSRVEWK